jgi:ribonuclease BN (tRNA processing enzyme)
MKPPTTGLKPLQPGPLDSGNHASGFPGAIQTKHFTAAFVGRLATDARVRKLIPFHFSKRYLERRVDILRELSRYYTGELMEIEARQPGR